MKPSSVVSAALCLFTVGALGACHGDPVGDAADSGADVAHDDTLTNDTSDGDVGGDTSDGDGGSLGCPSAHGPTMVAITHSVTARRYCIDSTEVTNAQFNEFLGAPGSPFDAPAQCAFDASSRPVPADAAAATVAARGMTWCYAFAYCKWAGKRLCRAVGGGAPTSDPALDEWMYACRNGDLATMYPYGATYDPTKCNTEDAGVGASVPTCHGTVAPFDRLFDMVGNVDEYYDGTTPDYRTSADMDASAYGTSAVGGNTKNGGYATCDRHNAISIGYGFPELGFRCCADAS